MILMRIPTDHQSELEAEWRKLSGGDELPEPDIVDGFDGFQVAEFVLEASGQVVTIVVAIAAYLQSRRGTISIGGVNIANADPKTIEAAIRANSNSPPGA